MTTNTRSLLTPIVFVVVVGLTLLSGLLQGRMRNRWGSPPDVAAAAKLLESAPTKFGDWELVEAQPLSDSTVKMLECAGYLCGTYRNHATGDQITMFVLVGPTGPISVHTPDICYPSRDYTIVRPREKVVVPNAAGLNAQLWALTLRSNDVSANLLRSYYAWSDGGAWTAADNPRFSYGGQPLLYKIQVAANSPGVEVPDPDELGQRFLRDLLPVLQRHLVTPQKG